MKKHFIIIFMLALYMTMASGCAGAKIVPSPNEDRLENNINAYNDIAEFLLEDYRSSEITGTALYVITDTGISIRMDDIFEFEDLEIDEEHSRNSQKIYDTFYIDHRTLGWVCVCENYVFFNNESGRVKYIYSENDTKPDFLDRRGGDGDIYVIKLFSKWFYGCQL